MTAIPMGELYVEGKDDMHTIIHLLTRHGFDFDRKPRPIEIKVAENDIKLLEGVAVAVKANKHGSVGFVLDLDTTVDERWQQIANRLLGSDLQATSPGLKTDLKSIPDQSGKIIEVPGIRARVGFWLMPDNCQPGGKLENLLDSLIPPQDALRSLAEESANQAHQKGAKFAEKDRIKAIMHTWLAWQEKPGHPYGTAIEAKYFNHDSPAARAFVEWCRTLFPAKA